MSNKEVPTAARVFRVLMLLFYTLGLVAVGASLASGDINSAMGGAFWLIPGVLFSALASREMKKAEKS